ncbi:hypothetical protein PVV74_11810 [Roseovarius sp. SK2]|uniref:hypothetical protein n=1 Tax=Roseovarius TaxID=74030 RepID=UPI00237C1634|nr:hypothetical protein [Roseovarius sp. SK2]MDD9726143.1 hypothetical protein [Roseovarius sp. SK2]
MDMSAFDGRKQAEEGVFEPLRHPYTGKPFAKGEGAPGFYVRGVSARSVQSRLAEMQKEAKDAAKDEESQEAAMERLHERLIDGAMKYIIRADDDMTINGEPVGANPDLIRKVLDGTFPEMRVVKDADGNPVTHEVKTDDGEKLEVPKFEMANEPFAQQMIKAAEDGSRFFGKTSKD